ncbi:hypothetical protein IGI37_001344 [Enterococcus sp. AZ194]|uniref:PTS system mannose/fructose/sorbose family transporter subunit IID n=1 Tax=Enterococcus sp. AZ194 TaxID=2774629 RepID=UPI003F239E6B
MNRAMFKLSKSEFKLLWKLFWRTQWLMYCTSYTKQQGTTWAWVMQPFLADIYGKETDEFYDAMQRHLDFFNTTPFVAGFIEALVLSMEYENKYAMEHGIEFDTTSIAAIKTALMGPLAGIGDAINLSVLRVVATGIALGLSATGNILGPILFFVLMFVPTVLIRWYVPIVGYKAGGKFISDALKSGTFNAITKGATVLGLIMTGAMVAQFVSFKTTYVHEFEGSTFNLQSVFDSILPGLLPLALTMICFGYLKKKNKPVRVIVTLFLAAVLLTVLGVTGG